ncbi:glycosyltransferase family 2 protein [Arthrobacter sp. NPDC057388]|uniref:glycosyltransferase family 2 protein n=1 Tax=Arthrobacter sp. NPDC057388 TaxID=3346116 RepID=UPI003645B983
MNDMLPSINRAVPSDLVVVLLATFNGSRYLRAQLDSIATQSYPHWRIVVADDGSSDDTLAVVQGFSADYPGRVQILRDAPVGSPRDNFFRLLRAAGPAPYFAFCDQDDTWSPDKLDRLVGRCQQIEARNHGTPCLVYSDLAVVDAQLELVNPSFINHVRARPRDITHKTLLTENAIPGCAMLLNAPLADVVRVREFDTSKAIMHDWWIALLAATVGHISYVPGALVHYRQHSTNTLGSVKRSGLAFILSKLLRGNRSTVFQTYAQAAEFASAYGDLLDPPVREDINAYASLYNRHKLERVKVILKRRILKQTPGRRVYQLLRA